MTSKGKNRLFTCIGYLILGIGCLGVLLPLSWMVITSLKSMADITLSRGLTLFPSGPTLENFSKYLERISNCDLYQKQHCCSWRIYGDRRCMCSPLRIRTFPLSV